MRQRSIAFWLLFLAWLLTGTASYAASSEAKSKFIVGRITNNIDENHPGTKAMAQYLASQLQDAGIKDSSTMMTLDIEQMIRDFKAGRVDMINDTVLTAARIVHEGDGELLLKAYRKRAGSHHTVFFARKDSGVNSLADLRGRVIAFEDNTSTAGYFIPAGVLLLEKYPLVHVHSPRERVPKDAIGYFFSGEEINSTLMVHKGYLDAGVLGNTDIETERSMPQEIRGDMKVFHRSVDFPRSLIVVRRTLPRKVKEQLKKTLLGLHHDPQNVSLLRGYHLITKFEELSDADMKGFKEAERMNKAIRAAALK